jgi:hypothetical protein
MRLDLALALIGGATVVAGQDKKPGKISGSGVYFTKVGTQTATLHWEKPTLGSHQHAIQGYKIQVRAPTDGVHLPYVATGLC